MITECRFILDAPAPGPWNMAADEALLGDAADNGVATLRFYRWSEPTLSLGYFQAYGDRQQHAASRDCAIVRRQTGGGAILHDRELTYSLTLPASHPFARQTQLLYAAVHDAFIAALGADGSSWSLRRRERSSPPFSQAEPFLCFQRQAPGDVLLVLPEVDGRKRSEWKILGSAQRRHRGAILQHGSLLLERSAAAPELPGLRDLVDPREQLQRFADPPGLAAVAGDRLEAALQMHFVHSQFPSELESITEQLATGKYGGINWTNRR